MIILEDKFSDNRNRWPTGGDTVATYGIKDGKYVLEHKRDHSSYVVSIQVGLSQKDEFLIQALIEKVAGSENTLFGLVWALIDINNFYEFGISGNGYFCVGKLQDGKWSDIRAWTLSQSINRGLSANLLSVKRSHKFTEFYVNNSLVERMSLEEEFFGSNIGYAVSHDMRVHVHNILVEKYFEGYEAAEDIKINPFFGPVSQNVNDSMAFVLMPFTDGLTRIYNSIVKPTVERAGLICRRADDFRTHQAIIQDVWKGICEARVIIADLTTLNPNVLYELGMAHALGKDTILVSQVTGSDFRLPFDIMHIRRIEYQDNAIGGKKLELELYETLMTVLRPGIGTR